MLNIIKADLFKFRKGKALWGIILGLLGIVILVAGVEKVLTPMAVQKKEDAFQTNILDEETMDLEEMKPFVPANGGEFLETIFWAMGDAFVLFLLPLIISIFGSDYSSGTYRNLLSYHSRREMVYTAKVITTVILTVMMVIGLLIAAAVVGGVVFGFGGFSGALVLKMAKGAVMMLPILTAIIAVGYCIMTFMKKTSYTIAIFLVGLVVWSLILQIITSIKPEMEWIMQLNLMNTLDIVGEYLTKGDVKIMISMLFSLIILVGTYILGLIRYKNTDFDFN